MFKTAALVCALSLSLAGCMASDPQRAIVGAAAGAVIADTAGYNAAVGAGAGAVAGLLIK